MFLRVAGFTGGNNVARGMISALAKWSDMILRQFSFASFKTVGTAMIECFLNTVPLNKGKIVDRRAGKFGASSSVINVNSIEICVVPTSCDDFGFFRILGSPVSRYCSCVVRMGCAILTTVISGPFWVLCISGASLCAMFFSVLCAASQVQSTMFFWVSETIFFVPLGLSSTNFHQVFGSVFFLCYTGSFSILHKEYLP